VTYVIAQPCIDIKDKACVEECPVDCIYEGQRSLYISPDECIDCGACEPVCPVEAIYFEDDVPAAWSEFTADTARFFTDTLPGQDAPLASPGGADKVGPLPTDTPFVAAHPRAVPAEAHG
jgi:NAD-dependent dihydropyrimidine dehydrogenase PreA subunit